MTAADKISYTLSTVVLVLFASVIVFFCASYFYCFSSSRELKDFTGDFVHVYIFGRGEDSISASVSLYSADGNEITRIERSWHSENISIDFIHLSFGEFEYAFPYRVYPSSSKRFNSGTFINKLYLKNKKCLLEPELFDAKKSRALYHLCRFAFMAPARLLKSNVRVEKLNLSLLESGTEFFIRWNGKEFSVHD